MRAIWITKYGGPDVLEVRESADPSPGEGEVRIRVKAAGLNFAEVMARQGLYPDAPKPPCVVGYEASGIVDAIGPGVTGVKEGDWVVAMRRFSAQADCIVAPVAQVLPMQPGMSFEEAAALPVNYLTAYHMLYRVAAVRPGERVLVHMAAGGVGVAVLQICKGIGGIETFGTASASKHDFLRGQGCTHPIDYRTQDYVAEVRKLTRGEGVDVVLDALGGADWKKGYELLKPAGRLVTFGFANMAAGEKRNLFRIAGQALRIPRFSPLGLMDKNRSVAGVNIGHLWSEARMLREELEALLVLFQRGVIKPHVGKVFPFAEAAEAHREIESRRNVGKVVLVP